MILTPLRTARRGSRLFLIPALRQRSFNRPFQDIEAILQSPIGDTRTARPFGHRPRFAEIGNQASVASITSLLAPGRPAAIVLGVGAVVIDAIQRMILTRLRSHVGIELTEIMTPFIGHHDSAATIEAIGAGVWITAALDNARPTPILCALPILKRAGRMTVRRHPLAGHVIFIAAARFRIAAHKIVDLHIGFTATRAAAQHAPFPSPSPSDDERRDQPDRGQSRKHGARRNRVGRTSSSGHARHSTAELAA